MDECSPHEIVKPNSVWLHAGRSTSIWGLFRPASPASPVPHLPLLLRTRGDQVLVDIFSVTVCRTCGILLGR
jgi:hypothetical protein